MKRPNILFLAMACAAPALQAAARESVLCSQSGETYGTTEQGGANGSGVVYRIVP